eukprot:3023334-Rhodomonas_salina.1
MLLRTPRSRAPPSEHGRAPELEALRPDAVMVDPVHNRISLLEFTRPSDTARHTLWSAAKIKEEKYQVLLQSLWPYARAGWRVDLLAPPSDRGPARPAATAPASSGASSNLHSNPSNSSIVSPSLLRPD